MPYEDIVTFTTVLFVVFGAVITVDKVLDIIKKHKKPKLTAEQELAQRQAACDRHFKSDLDRIQKLEAAQRQQQIERERPVNP